MKRTPLKRTAGLKRSGSISQISKKRVEQNKERRQAMKVVEARSGGKCEGRALIANVDPIAASNCLGVATDGHELRKRSRLGSITDPANIKHLCRSCHSWTESEPRKATEVGLLIPSWE